MRLLFKPTKEKLRSFLWRRDDPQFQSKYANLTNFPERPDRNNTGPAGQAVNQSRVRTAVCLFLVTPIMCGMLFILAFALMTMSSSSTPTNNFNDNWEENILRYAQQYEADQCFIIPNEQKIDCAPVGTVNEEICTQRKCCWSPKTEIDEGVNLKSEIGMPWCYYPLQYSGYSSDQPVSTQTGFSVDMHRKNKSQFIKDVETVHMDFKLETNSRLRVKITDPKQARFETPYPEVPEFNGPVPSSPTYDIQVKQGSSGFNVIRKETKEIIFQALDIGDLVYSDQYLEISAILPKGTSIYGLGEQQGPLKVNSDQNWKLITLFNRDNPPTENKNLYGSHPFYLAVEPSGNSHGFFLLNSNAIDIIVSPNPAITIRTIGGILDMYFFLGPSPTDVIRQYAEVVGTPAMPPYWALGYHLCRFEYGSLERTRQIWKQTIDAGIPFDTQWNDIDYMDSRNDFTYDKKKYAGLPEFVKEVHEAGMHYVPIVDPGISASETPGSYPPYDEGVKRDIFVKDSQGKIFVGKVWNSGSTVFPDFTNPKTVSYWTDMLKVFYDEVPFDGIWIDMNEPSNFFSGTAGGCPQSSLETPQYTPHVQGGVLNANTLCMTAQQYLGKHYDVHNLYGISEAIVTNFAMTQIRGKRPLIISRSTFAGHGHFASHWTGDNYATWYDMKMSIPLEIHPRPNTFSLPETQIKTRLNLGRLWPPKDESRFEGEKLGQPTMDLNFEQEILSFNMFQIPLVGADICGFNGNTTASLCLRWSQLGAFYPFSRNHNEDKAIDQDPVSLGPEVTKATKNALMIRYALLPYLYTLFYNAHKTGDTVARPLFFEFPKDPKTLSIDNVFLWGPWLLIVPVLTENVTEVETYLPEGLWYSFTDGQQIKSNGTQVTLAAPLDTIPILVRQGGILPLQPPAANTNVSRVLPFGLLVAPDEQNMAEGSLYWDDGESLHSAELGQYLLVDFKLEGASLQGAPDVTGYNAPHLGFVLVYNVSHKPVLVIVNGVEISTYNYHTEKKVLLIECDIDLTKSFRVEWT